MELEQKLLSVRTKEIAMAKKAALLNRHVQDSTRRWFGLECGGKLLRK